MMAVRLIAMVFIVIAMGFVVNSAKFIAMGVARLISSRAERRAQKWMRGMVLGNPYHGCFRDHGDREVRILRTAREQSGVRW
jgi:hypothetical protein